MSSQNELRAMVLAAGVGSRLGELSNVLPKPLVPIGGRPVMEHIVLLLKKHGFTKVISNTHHLSEKIQDYFKNSDKKFGVDIEFRYEDKLSGVAGGIRTCKDFLSQGTACIIMGDALTDIDLAALYEEHKKAVKENDCLVTIAMMKVEDTSQFGVIVTNEDGDQKGRVIKFQEKPKREEALSSWANTGVYFFEPEVYDFIPSKEEAPFYDVAKDLFPKLMAEDKYMQAVAVKEGTYWADIGNPEQYLKSMNDIAEGNLDLDFLPMIHQSAKIGNDVALKEVNQIGPNCVIEENVIIKNSVLWNNVTIKSGTKIENCIVGSNAVIESDEGIANEVLTSETELPVFQF